jgi:Domain of unknown function (DUF1996)
VDRVCEPARRSSKTLRFLAVTVTLAGTLGIGAIPADADVFRGSFSVFCEPSHRNRDDPIVYPGQPGRAHLHQFFGSRDTDAFSTFRSMHDARTTCGFRPDTAGYWFPALKNRKGNVVRPERVSAYYRGSRRTKPMPPGLKMIAGGDTSNLRRAGWNCGDGLPQYPRPVDCGGGRHLMAVVVFPSCWDGRRKDSPNHRAHVSYREGGRCPGHHPVEIPRLSLHVRYPMADGTGFRLSSDHHHRGGTTLHADFWNTWHQRALRRAVRRCINAHRNCKLGR